MSWLQTGRFGQFYLVADLMFKLNKIKLSTFGLLTRHKTNLWTFKQNIYTLRMYIDLYINAIIMKGKMGLHIDLLFWWNWLRFSCGPAFLFLLKTIYHVTRLLKFCYIYCMIWIFGIYNITVCVLWNMTLSVRSKSPQY